MSNLDPRPAAVSLQPGVAHAVDVLEARKVTLPASEGFDYGCSPRTARPVPAARRSPALPRIEPGMLAHLPVGVPSITVSAGPGRLFIVGGVPLGERLIMWWNFVARTNEEVVTARNA